MSLFIFLFILGWSYFAYKIAFSFAITYNITKSSVINLKNIPKISERDKIKLYLKGISINLIIGIVVYTNIDSINYFFTSIIALYTLATCYGIYNGLTKRETIINKIISKYTEYEESVDLQSN